MVSDSGGFELKAVVPWLIATIMGIIAWFCRRDMSRYDDGLKRIESLERNSVTYDHLERTLDKLRADGATKHAENKAYQEATRAENKEHLERIEEKIDRNEERASKTRHDTLDQIHAIALKFAATSRRSRNTE